MGKRPDMSGLIRRYSPVFLLLAFAVLGSYFVVYSGPTGGGLSWFFSSDPGCGRDYWMDGNWSKASIPYVSASPPKNSCFIGVGPVPENLVVRAEDLVTAAFADGNRIYSNTAGNMRCVDCAGRQINVGEGHGWVLFDVAKFGGMLRFDAYPVKPTPEVQIIALALIIAFLLITPEGTLKRASTVAAVAFLAGVSFLLPIYENVGYWGRGDWDYVFTNIAVVGNVLMQQHQLPFWNPYLCGGSPLLGFPGWIKADPFLIVPFVLGVVAGVKVNLLLFTMVGMFGCHLLASFLRIRTISRYHLSVVFMFSGFFAYRLYEGHYQYFALMYLPYITLFLLKSFNDLRHALALSLFIALFVLFAHPIMDVFLGLFLASISVAEAAVTASRRGASKPWWRPLAAPAVACGLACLLLAFLLLPELEFSLLHPRQLIEKLLPDFDIQLLYSSLARAPTDPLVPKWWGWHEFGGFIGIPALMLSFFGFVASLRRGGLLGPAVALVVFLLIILGSNSPFDLWGLLHDLPMVHSLRDPERGIGFVVFILAIYSSIGLSGLEGRFPRIANVVFAASFALIFLSNTQLLYGVFGVIPYDVAGSADGFRQIKYPLTQGAYSNMYPYIGAGVGLTNCYSSGLLERRTTSDTQQAYRGEAYLLGSRGTAALSAFSQNSFTVDVDAAGDDLLIVNQNYEQNWRVEGGFVREYKGLIAANVTSGRHQMRFYYLPWAFLAGCVLSIAGLFAFAYLARKYGLGPFRPEADDGR
ncbi:MAG: hypothetical protein V1875_02920 [Candidatus Altiarchaeota archaeon]